ncbi:hypothetical protein OCU04_006532 [Sclerotinia nivalis]|uniref:Zn(2)-C6 fungal-type domain-containing protein n=1 Tax=Sclerotinia nivalis TaxID=352851 RepID=A0A9X0AJY5_9HELO|nr:hypothetical protein OCU04_006532 [Sclerotinia nivalis]
MAQKPSATSKAKWLDNHIVHLLSWVNFTIEHKDTNFEETVAAHLKQKCETDYTLNQINRKLARLLERFGGRNNGTSYKTLLKKGSKCLVKLSAEITSQVELACKDLETEFRRNQEPPRRSSRSGSEFKTNGFKDDQSEAEQAGLIQEQQTQNTHTQNLSKTPTKIKFKGVSFTPDAPQHSAKRRKFDQRESTSSPDPLARNYFSFPDTIEDSQDENTQIAWEDGRNVTSSPLETSVGRQKSTKTRCTTCHQKKRGCDGGRPSCGSCIKIGVHHSCSYEEVTVSSKDRGERQNIQQPVLAVGNDATEEKTRCICGKIDGPTDWVQCKQCRVWQHCICVGVNLIEAKTMDYLCKECGAKAHNTKLKEIKPPLGSRDLGIQIDSGVQSGNVLLGLARKEISFLQSALRKKTIELRELEQERGYFEREARRLRSNRKQLKEQSPEYLLDQRDREIIRLNNELEELKNSSRFTKLGTTSHEVFNQNTIERINDEFGIIEQLPYRNDPVTVPFRLDRHKELEDIISKTFERGVSSMQVAVDLQASLGSMNTLVVLRALTACCLRIWVYESDFPMIEGSSSEYLAKMREILVTTDGIAAARNLDLATRHAMIMNDDFAWKFIEPEAERLTMRFSNIMAPLFSKEPNGKLGWNWDGVSTWNDDEEMWKDRQSRLYSLFREALRIKAESTLNLKDYDMVTFAPGTPYDHHCMTVETSNGMVGEERNDNSVVEFCIQPAVYVYNKESLADNTGTSALLSSSRNFVHDSGRRKPGLRPSIKAAVILGKGNGGS